MARIIRYFVWALGAVLIASLAATLICFPWSTDPEGASEPLARSANYYRRAYSAGADSRMEFNSNAHPLSAKEQFYIDFARRTAKAAKVEQKIGAIVRKYGLGNGKALEVGAGSGLLQDIVPDYTGLDISATARRFFHKPFVEASATDMPFADNSFDVIWTVWVLEHIPNPEKAMLEMRRVVKPGGYLILWPAWDTDRFVGKGYAARPYSDFDLKGKFVKALVPIVRSRWFHYLHYHQSRLLRSIASHAVGGPGRLHFIRLEPSYDSYWEADSDAAVSLNQHELYLWHASRGDVCVSCPPEWRMIVGDPSEELLVVRINK